MIDPMPLFPESMDFIPMLVKTDDLVARGLAAAQSRWEGSFAERHGLEQWRAPAASAAPEQKAGVVIDDLA